MVLEPVLQIATEVSELIGFASTLGVAAYHFFKKDVTRDYLTR